MKMQHLLMKSLGCSIWHYTHFLSFWLVARQHWDLGLILWSTLLETRMDLCAIFYQNRFSRFPL